MNLKILAVDTASSVATAAVTDNNKLLGEYSINHKKTHSQKLMPMIEDLMKSLELTPRDIDLYAASSGPGSFTGLRIGVTTIKAIAYAAGKPVIAVPTLDALAYNIPVCNCFVCPIMDARNNQVYTAVYRNAGSSQEKITDYMGVHIKELVEIIKQNEYNTVFTGDGVEIHRDYLKAQLGDSCEFAPGSLLMPRASSVAFKALVESEKGSQNAFEMVPFYLRQSQAEREYEKRQLRVEG